MTPAFALARRSTLAWLLLVAVGLYPAVAAAQVVRGTVSQETSGAPIAGALVELLFADSADARAASVLSDEAGRFELRAPAAGRYRLAAKRIGVRRFASAPFALGAGETRRESVMLAPLDYRLPTVVVTANALCSVADAERGRVAALWEEARTALDAAEISLRDRLFTAEVTRYVRDLEPTTLRVLDESRSSVRGVVASPFNALPADSLSVVGYWRLGPDGATQYFGPDARVLLSDAFQGDHCFQPVAGRGARQGLTGLAFAPTADRGVPDVAGTLWLDARTYELRSVEFRYDRVQAGVDSAAVGGEMHFARLPNGAWLVSRWHLRVPATGRSMQPLSTEGNAPWLLVRPSTSRLREEGGIVVTDAMRAPARPASIVGVLQDSAGTRFVEGATVRVGGTSRETTTDATGRFTFDALPPGMRTVVVHTPAYDALGLSAAEASLDLTDGDRQSVTLRLQDDRTLTARLCDGRGAPWGRGTVHATLRDAATGAPRAGVPATVRWMSTVGRAAGDSVAELRRATSDARGFVTFCELPSDRELTIQAAPASGDPPVVVRTRITAREVRHVELTLPAVEPNE